MSEQEVVQEKVSEKPREIPCIYGSEIHGACAVRELARETISSDISKWVKPKIMDEHMQEISQMLDRMMNAMTSMNLDRFCDHCPWRNIYIKTHP